MSGILKGKIVEDKSITKQKLSDDITLSSFENDTDFATKEYVDESKTDLSKYVTLDTDQTITGGKIFRSGLLAGEPSRGVILSMLGNIHVTADDVDPQISLSAGGAYGTFTFDTVTCGISLSCSFMPDTFKKNCDLGLEDREWRSLHVGSIKASDEITINNRMVLTSEHIPDYWNLATLTGRQTMTNKTFSNTITTTEILPSSNNVSDIGSTTKHYKNLYINNVIASEGMMINDVQVATVDDIPDSDNFVDLTTNQTIAGVKTFTENVKTFGTVTTGQKTGRSDGLQGCQIGTGGVIYLQSPSPQIQFFKDNSTSLNGYIRLTALNEFTINSDFLPESSSIRTIGSDIYRWANVYTTLINTSGNVSIGGNLGVGGKNTVSDGISGFFVNSNGLLALQGTKTVNAQIQFFKESDTLQKGTIGLDRDDETMFINSTFKPQYATTSIDLGTPTVTWRDLYLRGNAYINGVTVATLNDIPNISNFVTQNTEQTITGKKIFQLTANNSLTLSGSGAYLNISPNLTNTSWARGVQFYNNDSVRLGQYGLYVDMHNTPIYSYINTGDGVTDSNFNDKTNVRIYPNGRLSAPVLSTNYKTSSTDGLTGGFISQNGGIYLQGTTTPSLQFFVGNSTSATSSISGKVGNILNLAGYVLPNQPNYTIGNNANRWANVYTNLLNTSSDVEIGGNLNPTTHNECNIGSDIVRWKSIKATYLDASTSIALLSTPPQTNSTTSTEVPNIGWVNTRISKVLEDLVISGTRIDVGISTVHMIDTLTTEIETLKNEINELKLLLATCNRSN